MIDHFKKLKNSIDRLKMIEKSINLSIVLKKLIRRSQKIDQVIDQTIKEKKMENRTSFYLLLLKIKKKIDHSIIPKLIDRKLMIEIPRSKKKKNRLFSN